jgi:hypothetical protein
MAEAGAFLTRAYLVRGRRSLRFKFINMSPLPAARRPAPISSNPDLGSNIQAIRPKQLQRMRLHAMNIGLRRPNLTEAAAA